MWARDATRSPGRRAIAGALGLLVVGLAPAGAFAARPDDATDPPNPPLTAAEGAAYTGIAQLDLGALCTASLVETGDDDGPAYLISNGHCTPAFDAGANAVLTDVATGGQATFGLFADSPAGTATLAVTGIVYATMKGVDVSIIELDSTLGAAKARGLQALPIAATTPATGTAVVNVGIPVGGIAQNERLLRRGACTLAERVDLVEDRWHFEGAWAADCPGISGGSSGSPVIDADGAIVGLVNTSAVGIVADGDCALNEPCELGVPGTTTRTDRVYAIPVAGVGACFAAGSFDLAAAGCPLEPPGGPTVDIVARTVRTAPLSNTAIVDAHVTWGDGIVPVTKVGQAGVVDCADPAGYARVEPTNVSDGSLRVHLGDGASGMYLLCLADPAALDDAAVGVIYVEPR